MVDVSDDLIHEQAYTVARGVRSLALVGHCPADSITMLTTATRIEQLAIPGAIPFVIDRGDGVADFGFARASWAIDLYRWMTNNDAVPEVHQHRIVALLLGYDPLAVREFEELASGRVFDASCASPATAAS